MAEGRARIGNQPARRGRGVRAGLGLIRDDDDDRWDDEGGGQFPGQRRQRPQGVNPNRPYGGIGNQGHDPGRRQQDQGQPRRGRGQGRGGFGGARREIRHKQLTRMNFLEDLLEREPSDILQTLGHPDNGFRDGLTECIHKPEMLRLFIQILAKGLECNSLEGELGRIIVILKETKFVDTASNHFLDVLEEDRAPKLRQYNIPLKAMIKLHLVMMRKNPDTVIEFLGAYDVVKMAVDYMRDRGHGVDDQLIELFRNFTEHKEELLRKRQRRKPQATHEGRVGLPDVRPNEDRMEPPDDFREIDIFPQIGDMQVDDDRYLRSNKKKGGYADLDHYLDVQFRLLREDFIAPLREGICEYVQVMEEHGRRKRKPQDFRLYDNVTVISPDPGENGLCHVLQFDISRMKNVRWQSSKRLIFGSLLCLSADNFRTLHFATVVNRDVKLLQKGLIVVRFEQNIQEVDDMYGIQFTMAETTAYFESYRHVLKGLQRMQEGDLPFERYIVNCESRVQAPAYLRRRPGATFDLRPLVDEENVLHERRVLEELLGDEPEEEVQQRPFSARSAPAANVHLLERTSWPPPDLLHLDESQFKAIHTALTKEFVITQGPPGTGKTYIGLKIVKALLHNKSIWSKHPDTGVPDKRPMLVVCYTNHALDQFLEGIVNFFKGDVLRVGGRSQSEILKPINLHNFRMRFRHEKKIPVQVFQGRRAAKNEMDYVSTEIAKISARIRVVSSEIMREDFLRPFMGVHYQLLVDQFQQMLQVYPEARYALPNNFSVIVEWLELGNLAAVVEMEGNMAQEGPNFEEDDLIDVEDEVEAVQAERQLDDGDDELPSDEDLEDLIDEHMELSKKERRQLKAFLAESEQQKSVALHVDDLTARPKGTQEGQWQTQKKQRKKMKRTVQKNLAALNVMTEEEANAHYDLWRMSLDEKWKLYRLWQMKCCEWLRSQVKEKQEEFEAAAQRYREALMQEDKEVMRHSTVIGMTTTGAARYQAILQEIKPRIIVVEEAAEVLEAHIITTLSRGCEHLILIGDHKQLKPNPTVYKLAKDYNLDVSLFERMINNGVQCDCLQLQHRMRPQIAELMDHVYTDLRNHDDVMHYENVRGISTNIFFVNHGLAEKNDDDLRSHSNEHEAAYIVGLCNYLLLQGYKPEQITVLTLYSGQLFCLRGMMPKERFDGVRVTVVDNYQGEENDIILLSLVRSNEEGNIGFLKIDNRVCVALSRAKKGFYAIGNFELLRTKSRLWNEIVIDMKTKGRLGDGLKLVCQNHPDDESIVVKYPNDFAKAPEGGCLKQCGYRLDCGHSCEMFCHVMDREHTNYKCQKKCNKIICGNQHRCKSICSKECPPCVAKIEKRMPRCGHMQKIPCSMPPEDFACQEPCREVLPCGHQCQAICGMAHTQYCGVAVEKTWDCGHKGQIKCCQKDVAVCPTACDQMLDCTHRCTGTCGLCFQGRLHRACKHDCARILVCGHDCTDNCSQCPPCKRPCENKCQHSRCQKRCGELCTPCKEPCNWRCQHHKCNMLCCEPCDRPKCDIPCRKLLTCGHLCIGLCGEPCPTDCRICDQQKVTELLFGDEDEPDARFVRLEDCRRRCIIEVKAMDHYMETKPDEKGEIKLKECPKCKTPIRTTTRYRGIINKVLQDIEDVKRKVLSNKERVKKLEEDIKLALIEIPNIKTRVTLKRRLSNMTDPKSENELVALMNQVTFGKHIYQLMDDWKDLKGLVMNAEKEKGLHHLDNFLEWVLEERSIITPQETMDALNEIDKSRALLKLLLYQMTARAQRISFSEHNKQLILDAEKYLRGPDKFDDKMKEIIGKCLHALKAQVPIGISPKERVMIVQAMKLPKGHWFKCPNGHVYAIGDCGGAIDASICPDCKAAIGGTNYQLREGNQLAEEMDNAPYAAWSDQANVGDHGFNIQF